MWRRGREEGGELRCGGELRGGGVGGGCGSAGMSELVSMCGCEEDLQVDVVGLELAEGLVEALFGVVEGFERLAPGAHS